MGPKLTMLNAAQAGETPHTTVAKVSPGEPLYLAQLPWLDELCDPGHVYVFELWDLIKQGWHLMPWKTSAIILRPGCDTVFIRVCAIECRGFSSELRRYDEMHGLALRPQERVSKLVSEWRAQSLWLVIWTQVRA